jgi:hypothetical protein
VAEPLPRTNLCGRCGYQHADLAEYATHDCVTELASRLSTLEAYVSERTDWEQNVEVALTEMLQQHLATGAALEAAIEEMRRRGRLN